MKILIPIQLQKITKSAEITLNSRNVGELIGDLIFKFPSLKDRLINDNGQINKFVNVYVNDEDIRFLQNQDTLLKDGDVVSIIAATAGG